MKTKELKKFASSMEGLCGSGKKLTSHSKFGQDLAAPAACQRHLSLQPVPSLSPHVLYSGWGGR